MGGKGKEMGGKGKGGKGKGVKRKRKKKFRETEREKEKEETSFQTLSLERGVISLHGNNPIRGDQWCLDVSEEKIRRQVDYSL